MPVIILFARLIKFCVEYVNLRAWLVVNSGILSLICLNVTFISLGKTYSSEIKKIFVKTNLHSFGCFYDFPFHNFSYFLILGKIPSFTSVI